MVVATAEAFSSFVEAARLKIEHEGQRFDENQENRIIRGGLTFVGARVTSGCKAASS